MGREAIVHSSLATVVLIENGRERTMNAVRP